MAAEDFSFPVVGEGSSSCIDSPPLWHSSPVASREETTSSESNDAQHAGNMSTEKNRHSIDTRLKRIVGDIGSNEETMDMLWEDFNEELSRRRTHTNSQASSMGMIETGHVQNALTVSKTAKKPGVLVLIKVLKKLFPLHNDDRSLKKNPWHLKQPHSCKFR